MLELFKKERQEILEWLKEMCNDILLKSGHVDPVLIADDRARVLEPQYVAGESNRCRQEGLPHILVLQGYMMAVKMSREDLQSMDNQNIKEILDESHDKQKTIVCQICMDGESIDQYIGIMSDNRVDRFVKYDGQIMSSKADQAHIWEFGDQRKALFTNLMLYSSQTEKEQRPELKKLADEINEWSANMIESSHEDYRKSGKEDALIGAPMAWYWTFELDGDIGDDSIEVIHDRLHGLQWYEMMRLCASNRCKVLYLAYTWDEFFEATRDFLPDNIADPPSLGGSLAMLVCFIGWERVDLVYLAPLVNESRVGTWILPCQDSQQAFQLYYGLRQLDERKKGIKHTRNADAEKS